MTVNLQAGGNIRDAGNVFEASVDQVIKGVADSVVRTVQAQTGTAESKSVTDQLVDGFLSGSTFVKIVWIVVIGGGLISVLVLVLKLLGGKKEEVSATPTDLYSQYA